MVNFCLKKKCQNPLKAFLFFVPKSPLKIEQTILHKCCTNLKCLMLNDRKGPFRVILKFSLGIPTWKFRRYYSKNEK